eukprot:Gregarina_sp_Poly_1__2221@NODE_1593_length_3762_cov_126_889310_g1049_i0_p2_GENE_NODE_1593_length_3762_cov_126_889310_g1049_i0NODE_1593_length_3762_cov_126_889310_g1049_i0_p2_ORF_typecomplete_len366_score43_78_NODE_1593_length_3762_cov_126_889310_g1049_i026633688
MNQNAHRRSVPCTVCRLIKKRAAPRGMKYFSFVMLIVGSAVLRSDDHRHELPIRSHIGMEPNYVQHEVETRAELFYAAEGEYSDLSRAHITWISDHPELMIVKQEQYNQAVVVLSADNKTTEPTLEKALLTASVTLETGEQLNVSRNATIFRPRPHVHQDAAVPETNTSETSSTYPPCKNIAVHEFWLYQELAVDEQTGIEWGVFPEDSMFQWHIPLALTILNDDEKYYLEFSLSTFNKSANCGVQYRMWRDQSLFCDAEALLVNTTYLGDWYGADKYAAELLDAFFAGLVHEIHWQQQYIGQHIKFYSRMNLEGWPSYYALQFSNNHTYAPIPTAIPHHC